MLASRLRDGLELPDRKGESVLYRYIAEGDDLHLLTELLHRAYATLAAAGMRFVASHQDVHTTRRRVAKGETILAVANGTIVGTVTLATTEGTGGSPFYDRPDVVSVGQFAVEPAMQGRGVGSALMGLAEQRAFEQGASYVALDTSEHARDLIALYGRRGYRFVEHVKWGGVNYRSVVLAKRLERNAGLAAVRDQ